MNRTPRIPVKPRLHCLADSATVQALLKAMRADDSYIVNYNKDSGTVSVTSDAITGKPVIMYRGMQKGHGAARWIVTYSTDYFAGGE